MAVVPGELKLAVAREVFTAPARHCEVLQCGDLRPARRAKTITRPPSPPPSTCGPPEWANSADARDDDFADRYRDWLKAA